MQNHLVIFSLDEKQIVLVPAKAKFDIFLDDDSPDEDNDNVRIKFAGIKTGKKPEMSNNGRMDDEEEEHGWEEQQVH